MNPILRSLKEEQGKNVIHLASEGREDFYFYFLFLFAEFRDSPVCGQGKGDAETSQDWETGWEYTAGAEAL